MSHRSTHPLRVAGHAAVAALLSLTLVVAGFSTAYAGEAPQDEPPEGDAQVTGVQAGQEGQPTGHGDAPREEDATTTEDDDGDTADEQDGAPSEQDDGARADEQDAVSSEQEQAGADDGEATVEQEESPAQDEPAATGDDATTDEATSAAEGSEADATTGRQEGTSSEVAPAQNQDWQVSQSAEPASGSTVLPGQEITYRLEVDAPGPRPVTGAEVDVDLSGVLEHASVVEPLPAFVTVDGEELTWDLRRPVRPGSPATVQFSVQVDGDAIDTTLTSVASPGTAGGECTDCTVTHTVPAPTWELSVGSTMEPGSTVLTNTAFLYPMTVENTSPLPVSGAQVVADLSGMMEHASISQVPQDAVFDEGTQMLTWSAPDLAAGESVTERFQVRISAPSRGSEVTAAFSADAEYGQCIGECEFSYDVSGFDASLSVDPPAGEVVAGEEISYTFDVENISGGELTGAQVRMNLNDFNAPILGSADLVEPLDEAFDMYANVIAWNIPDLESGESAEISFAVQVREDATAGAEMFASIGTYTARHGGLVVSDSVRHTVAEPVVTWELSQSAEPASGSAVQAGEEITYTLDVDALGPRPVTGVEVGVDLSGVLEHASVVEPLPPFVSMDGDEITWDLRHPVHPSRPASVDFTVAVDDDAAAGATLTSVASPGTPGGQCTDCTVTHTVAAPSWEVEISPNQEPGSTLLTNAAVLPTMTAENTSDVLVSGAEVVADLAEMGVERYDVSQVPDDAVYDPESDLLTWSVPDLEPGESATELFQVRLSPTSRGAEVSMDFTTEGTGGECVSGCESSWHVFGFDASASADVPPGVVGPGDEITYTWEVENISGGELTGANVRSNLNDWNSPVLGSADLVEPLDEQLRMFGNVMNWDIPDLGPGEEAEVSFSVVVREDATDGADLRSNINTGTARHGGRTLTDPIVHTVGVPSWEVSARAADVRGITIPDEGTLRPNGQLNYHLTAENTSGVTITDGVVVADVSGLVPYADIEALGEGAEFDADDGVVRWSVPDLAAAESAAVSFRANLRFDDAPNAVLPLSVSTEGTGGECVDGCELVHYATGFEASMTTDPPAGAVEAGDEITYTWHVQNTSQAEISGAYVRAQMRDVLAHSEIVEPLPDGVAFAIGTVLNWQVPDLGPQDSAQVSFAVVVDDDAPVGAELGKQITAGANSFGVSFGERSATHTVDQVSWEVTARAAQVNGITIPDEGTVRPNGQLNYHITAENTSGLSLPEGAVIADVSGLLPYADIEALTGGAEFDAENGLVRWWAPELQAGESAAFTFRANLRFADAPGAVLPLSVTTQGAGGECVDGCDLVHYATAFEASVSADPPSGEVRAGDEITYTWQVQNTSQAQISGAYVRAQMSDVLAHADLVEPLPDGVDFAIGTVLNWRVPDLEAGETARVSFTVVVDEDTEQGAELGMSITAGANSFGVSFGDQEVEHTVSVSVTPPGSSLPPALAVLLGLAKWILGFLIWLF